MRLAPCPEPMAQIRSTCSTFPGVGVRALAPVHAVVDGDEVRLLNAGPPGIATLEQNFGNQAIYYGELCETPMVHEPRRREPELEHGCGIFAFPRH